MRSADEVAAMQCPVCRTALAMSDRQGVEIDYCPQCRGVWLDRGELDKIIERSHGPAPAPAPQQQPRQAPQSTPQQPWSGDHRDSGYHGQSHGKPYYKKRKSWLEEIFD